MASFTPGAHKADNVRASINQSFDLLKVNKCNILYLHAPERTTPLEEVLKTMDEEYRKGKYEKFGISNYTAAEVAEIVAICDKHGYVRPSVYQVLLQNNNIILSIADSFVSNFFISAGKLQLVGEEGRGGVVSCVEEGEDSLLCMGTIGGRITHRKEFDC